MFSPRDSGQPAVEFGSAKTPQLANLNSDYCSSASHSLEGFRVDLQESSCLIGVEQRLELQADIGGPFGWFTGCVRHKDSE